MKKHIPAIVLITALAAIAYSNSFDAAFHFDDNHQIANNANLRNISNIPRFFFSGKMGSFLGEKSGYRPLTMSSFATNYAISGNDVCGYHAVNFVLHLMVAFMVYLVVGMVMDSGGRERGYIPLLASLIFLLHPVQPDTVTYISGRALLLSSLFYMLGLYSFIRYRRGSNVAWAVVVPVVYMLGLLAKETIVSLPALMLAYDLLFTKSATDGGPDCHTVKARRWLIYIPLAAMLAGFIALKQAMQGFVALPERAYSHWAYLLSESKALLIYLRVLMLPVNLNADYNLPPTSSVDGWVVLSVLLICAGLFGLYRYRRVEPAISLFGAWFIIMLLPESSLIPIPDIAVEYRVYLAMAGLVAALLLIAARCMKPIGQRYKFALTAAVCVIVLLETMTYARNRVFATERSFWGDIAAKSPSSARAQAGLGNALSKAGRYADAIPHMEAALLLDPENPLNTHIYEQLGEAYVETGDVAKAAVAYENSLKLLPGNDAVRYNLAECYRSLGRYREARAELETLVSGGFEGFNVYLSLAEAYKGCGMVSEARDAARKALALAEDESQAAEAKALLEGK